MFRVNSLSVSKMLLSRNISKISLPTIKTLPTFKNFPKKTPMPFKYFPPKISTWKSFPNKIAQKSPSKNFIEKVSVRKFSSINVSVIDAEESDKISLEKYIRDIYLNIAVSGTFVITSPYFLQFILQPPIPFSDSIVYPICAIGAVIAVTSIWDFKSERVQKFMFQASMSLAGLLNYHFGLFESTPIEQMGIFGACLLTSYVFRDSIKNLDRFRDDILTFAGAFYTSFFGLYGAAVIFEMNALEVFLDNWTTPVELCLATAMGTYTIAKATAEYHQGKLSGETHAKNFCAGLLLSPFRALGMALKRNRE